MIDKFKPIQCNGCKMCADVCPKVAISFKDDKCGFWQPSVDYSLCVKCGACVKKCPQKNNGLVKRDQIVKAFCAWSNDNKIRLLSTSGGVFYQLAASAINKGGFVIGCTYEENFHKAKHVVVSSLRELEPLVQSKYLQSDTKGIYKELKSLLNTGKPVLFVGTPCQNAAVTMFLGKEYPNLLQVEFICRGITSPLAHAKYLDWLEQKHKSRIVYFRSKDKRRGWNQFGTYALFENGEEYFSNRGLDPKVVSYHQDLTIRESCSDCKFKGLSRVADLTLADFWGVKKDERNPNLEMGTSAVLVNSQKGEKAIDETVGLSKYEVEIKDVSNGNPALLKNVIHSKYRKKFWRDFGRLPYDLLTEKYAARTKKYRAFRTRVGKLVKALKKPFKHK